jgi:hypothetical protein
LISIIATVRVVIVVYTANFRVFIASGGLIIHTCPIDLGIAPVRVVVILDAGVV